MYTEIEIERGDEAWDTEKETKKEAESDHREKSMAHQHWMIERDTEIVFVNVAATSVSPASYHCQFR